MKLTIRDCEVEDWEYIYNLNLQLGFTIQKEKVRKRLCYLLEKDENKIFVAEYDHKVIGYVHGCESQRIYDDKMFHIHTLIVEENYRGKKVGYMLINIIENWSKQKGYKSTSLLSRDDRVDAHKFYKNNGYINERTQKYFLKYF